MAGRFIISDVRDVCCCSWPGWHSPLVALGLHAMLWGPAFVPNCSQSTGLECLPLLDVFTPGLVAVLSVPASSVANPILALTARLRAFRLRPSQHYVVIGAGGVTYDMSTFAVSKV